MNEQQSELTTFGYLTAKARRGLITWGLGILATLLFLSVGLNIWLVKSGKKDQKELNEKFTGVLIDMIKTQSKTEVRVDTTLNH